MTSPAASNDVGQAAHQDGIVDDLAFGVHPNAAAGGGDDPYRGEVRLVAEPAVEPDLLLAVVPPLLQRGEV